MPFFKFKLVDKMPVPVDVTTERGLIEWAANAEEQDWIVGKTWVNNETEVSTVFLGIDHRHYPPSSPIKQHTEKRWMRGRAYHNRIQKKWMNRLELPPILFESMVFRKGTGVERIRCCTWKDAERMHELMVQYCFAMLEESGDIAVE